MVNRGASRSRRADHDGLSPTRAGATALAPLVVVLLVAAAFAVTAPEPGIDTWTSLAAGRHIAAHGVGDADPFSFASRPAARAALPRDAAAWQRLLAWAAPSGWINQAWAGHLVLFGAFAVGGLSALLLLKWLAYAAVGALLVAHARLRGARRELAFVTAVLALAAYRPFAQARAQLFTDLFAAAFLLLLALARLRDRRWLWALAPLVAVWSNFHGGFVFAFVMLAVAATVSLIAWLRDRRPGSPAGAEAAALALVLAAALAGAVVASPFRLANLLHPLAITIGADAAEWRKVNEWQPLLAGGTPLDRATWAAVAFLGAATAFASRRASPHAGKGAGTPQRFDTAAALMLAATLLMAVQSLRFVPLACLVAAPLVAAWGEEALAGLARARPRRRQAGTPVRRLAAAVPWLAACLVAAWFGVRLTAWAQSPWPADDRRTAVADRLLQTHDRPWEACEFLRANAWHGRVWNFWEEGGFLSWCQDPDAATGRPPLQVLVDGRAQQAFDAAVSREYGLFIDGGPGGAAARATGGSLTPALGQEGMQWLRRRLQVLGTSIAHVPEEWGGTFPEVALTALPNWYAVYADERHTILVDTETPAGQAMAAPADGAALVYPEPAAGLLAQAVNRARGRGADDARRAVELARQAYAARPSARAVAVAASAARATQAAEPARAFCTEVADEFQAAHRRYAAADGYASRLAAARTAFSFLALGAERRGDAGELRRAREGLALVAAEETRVAAVAW